MTVSLGNEIRYRLPTVVLVGGYVKVTGHVLCRGKVIAIDPRDGIKVLIHELDYTTGEKTGIDTIPLNSIVFIG